MSQKAVMVRIQGTLYPKVLSYVPDYNDAIRICMLYNPNLISSSRLEFDYEWIEIGSGKSGADTFYDEEVLLLLYGSSYEDYRSVLQCAGDTVRTVEQGSYFLSCDH